MIKYGNWNRETETPVGGDELGTTNFNIKTVFPGIWIRL